MQFATVVGQCTATVKDASLEGRKLALVQAADPQGIPSGAVEVALDTTGAGVGQLVLVVRGSAARLPAETRQLASDLTIVAIVDEVTTAPRARQAAGVAEMQPRSSRPKKAPSDAAARTRTRGK